MVSERSVLVTGSSGFIGSNLLQRLVEDGKSAVGYDVAPPPPHLKDGVRKKIIKGDLLDFPRLLRIIKDHNVEGIIHAIAMQPSTGTEEMPMQAIRVNVEGTLNVLEAARLEGLRRVVFCSTIVAYGKRGLVKVKEDEPPLLPFENIYALSKFTAEQLCLWYHERHEIDGVILRLASVYGPGQRPFQMPFIAGAQPIDWFVHSALKHGRIEMGQGGDTQKDFTYVKDVVQGILLAYEKEEPTYRLYNLSSGKHILFRDVTNVIKKLLPDVSVNIGPGVLEVQGLQDISRARSDLDYEPQYDLEKGVKDYIQWLRPRTNMFPSPPPRVPKGAG